MLNFFAGRDCWKPTFLTDLMVRQIRRMAGMAVPRVSRHLDLIGSAVVGVARHTSNGEGKLQSASVAG